MKIFIEKPKRKGDIYTLNFGENCFIHLINDWEQILGKFNWYTFHILHVYMENDVMSGGFEFECIVLGIGFRFRYNYAFWESEAGKRMREYKENKL